ncbi:Alpha/Beta hydrolase protein [Kalaharituber pfeilii]|nr:Alpha/Beta hydrolase protein [Kalaharituber pfeilii]
MKRSLLRLSAAVARPSAPPSPSAPSALRAAKYPSIACPASSASAHRALSTAAPPRPCAVPSSPSSNSSSSNTPLSFPCLDALEARTHSLQSRAQNASSSSSGPEPTYATGAHLSYHSTTPLLLDYGGVLPTFTIAYETWGNLNPSKSNAILLHTGLSASSHAHSNPPTPNPAGGCYGSTGPSSIDPADGKPYATRFPILTLQDMVRGQFRLLDHLGIDTLYASVGSSMGGMLSLASAALFPGRVSRIVSISGCARSHPYSIAMRHTQRQVLMADPAWNRGFYYDSIATITYRSGPEWEQRFGRHRADPSRPPALCPDFLIETYLDHAGEKWCLQYDANSLLYVSKAMDLFDLGAENARECEEIRERNRWKVDASAPRPAEGGGEGRGKDDTSCTLTLPAVPYTEIARPIAPTSDAPNAPSEDLVNGLLHLSHHPTLVLGVASDILFPAWQQREVAETLRGVGNRKVTHVELGEDKSLFGHDTFLLDLVNVGGAVGRFLKE